MATSQFTNTAMTQDDFPSAQTTSIFACMIINFFIGLFDNWYNPNEVKICGGRCNKDNTCTTVSDLTKTKLYMEKTRTVRGSDYSPAIELSEQKGKLVTATGDTEKYSEKQAKSG